MNFPKQILAEAKNMLRSKFILISMILAFTFITIGVPVFSLVMDKINGGNNYYYGGDQEDITINGVVITSDNEFFWEIRNLVDQQGYIDQMLESKVAQDYALDVTEKLLDFYATYAGHLEPMDDNYNSDYRSRLMYQMRSYITDLYVLNVSEPDAAALAMGIEAVSYGSTSVDTLLKKTEAERADYIADAELDLADFDELMKNNEFAKYAEIQKRIYGRSIEENLKRIETLEADIIANPDQEEYASKEIENLKRSNASIEETEIPELDYRVEHNVVYYDGSWEDEAIRAMSRFQNTIRNATDDIMTEEEFNEDRWNADRYGSYQNYLTSMENDRKDAEEGLFIANSSLESGKPDMDYVPKGARNALYQSFSLSMLLVILSALIGGWCIATEFSSGTVRILMIRPRTRTKVFFSRFFAGLSLTYLLYLATFIVLLVTQGIKCGFSDYFLPNYTASGDVNFFVMWFGDFLANSVSFVFIYSLAFAMSAIVKNIAVAIIVPTVALLGASIAMSFLSSQPAIDFIAFTPMPYLAMSDIFNESWQIGELMNKGVPISIPLGVAMMFVYSAILVVIALTVFKKKDITN